MVDERQETPQGFEYTFAVNHLAPFLLTGLLLPQLKAAPAARIVNVSSEAHRFVSATTDWQLRKSYTKLKAYSLSKLANILFTKSLANRLSATEITTNALHPGAVASNFGNNSGALVSAIFTVIRPLLRSSEKAARIPFYLSTSEAVANITGEYFKDNKVTAVSATAQSTALAEKLWQESEKLTGFTYPTHA